MVTATRGAGLAPECRARVRLPAAHEVTPADTVEVTACGENRLPAAGTHAARSNPCATGAHYRGRRWATAHKER